MPFFAWIGYDGPDGLALRKLHRDEHVAGLEALDREGRIIHAGPILGATGDPIGSVVLFEAESLDAARCIAKKDPYVVRGIFARYELYETRVTLPKVKSK